MGVKLTGVKEFKAVLEKQSRVQELARPVVKYHGSQLQQNAQRYAPVDTGNLKRSIRLEIKDAGMTAEIAATAEYSPYVEYGTRFMLAKPYMQPAFLRQKDRFISDLKKVLGQ